mmetsp:Transcript_16181/g.44234  ORF Transcript_16181/g.44234 Transcript_16181/m.44234 type:complete len:203 (+) Transcript_16181:1311-1919(+)
MHAQLSHHLQSHNPHHARGAQNHSIQCPKRVHAVSRACAHVELTPQTYFVGEMSSHRTGGEVLHPSSMPSKVQQSCAAIAMGAAIVTLGMPFVLPPPAAAIYGSPSSDDNFENIPGTLSSSSQEDGSKQLSNLLGGKNGKQVQGCTRTCLPTCVRGGSNGGAPGLGPLSMRRDVIVFKDGFRSRYYCLTECANACSRLAQAK